MNTKQTKEYIKAQFKNILENNTEVLITKKKELYHLYFSDFCFTVYATLKYKKDNELYIISYKDDETEKTIRKHQKFKDYIENLNEMNSTINNVIKNN